MIASHTLTISEIATQLPHLFDLVKKAPNSLWLTKTKDEDPVMVVVAANEYKQSQIWRNLLYEWQLSNLKQCLDRVEKSWENEFLKEECV